MRRPGGHLERSVFPALADELRTQQLARVSAGAQGGLRQVHMDLIGVVEERPDEAEQL